MKTVISSNNIKFYDNDNVPYAQVLATNNELAFVDENNEDIEIENLYEDIQDIHITVNSNLLDVNGKYNLNLNLGTSDFNIIIDEGANLNNINLFNPVKGFTGVINLNINENKTIIFFANHSTSDIKWISSEKTNFIVGSFLINYFVYSSTEVLIWCTNESNDGNVYTPLNSSLYTIQQFNVLAPNLVQTFTLPNYINTFTAFVWGAGGDGGHGGYSKSTITLPEFGMNIYIVVGICGSSESGVGGGASLIYYIYDNIKYDIIVAGGGGVYNGGGLISIGPKSASLLKGSLSENYTTGLGQADGSGSGYYAGENGSGGCGYIGSNIFIMKNNILVDNYGSLNDLQDVNSRYDLHNKCIYTNSLCTSTNNIISDYYHAATGGGNLGNSLQNGFVYIYFNNNNIINTFGINSLHLPANSYITPEFTNIPTFHDSSTATHYKYFLYHNNILLTNGLQLKNVETTITVPHTGFYEYVVIAFDSNSDIYVGNRVAMRWYYTEDPTNPNLDALDYQITNKSILINKINYNEGDYNNVTLSDNGKYYHLEISNLPKRFYINHDSNINLLAYRFFKNTNERFKSVVTDNINRENNVYIFMDTTLVVTVSENKFTLLGLNSNTNYYLKQGIKITFNFLHPSTHIFQLFQYDNVTKLYDQSTDGNEYSIDLNYTGPLIIKCPNHSDMGSNYVDSFYVYPDTGPLIFNYYNVPGISQLEFEQTPSFKLSSNTISGYDIIFMLTDINETSYVKIFEDGVQVLYTTTSYTSTAEVFYKTTNIGYHEYKISIVSITSGIESGKIIVNLKTF